MTPPVPNEAGDTAVLSVVPKSGPSTEQTEDLVAEIRDHGDATGSTPW